MRDSEWKYLLKLLGEKLAKGASGVYKAERFRGTLRGYINSLLCVTEYHHTSPGELDCTVSSRNSGETALQRALYQAPSRLLRKGRWCEIKWLDLELPVVPTKASRKRSVDLIAELPDSSALLAELKSSQASQSTGADYAIIEALTYVAAIRKNSSRLAELMVSHPGARGQVDWIRLASASEVLVIANHSFWRLAKEVNNRGRITELCREVKNVAGIDVLLREFPDHNLIHRRQSNGRSVVELEIPSAANSKVDLVPVFDE